MAVFSISADDEIDSNKAFILLGMSGALKVRLRSVMYGTIIFCSYPQFIAKN